MKKILFTLLLAILCLSALLCFSACGDDGNGLAFTLSEDGKSYALSGIGSCTDKDIVIPSEYDGKPVTSIADYALSNSGISSVVVPDTVTYIGNGAFAGCSRLKSINIPDSVTYIGYSAFQYCLSLESINIPDSVTYIGSSAFYECQNLSNASVGKNVQYIGPSTFFNCPNLTYNEYGNCYYLGSEANKYLILISAKSTDITSASIPSSTKFIGRCAFANCSKLTSVAIPESVIFIDYQAFNGCNMLSDINIPDGVKYIGAEAFRGCTNAIETEGDVSYVDKWVIGCKKNATSVTLRNDTVGIAGGAFYECQILNTVVIPDSVKTIGYMAFSFSGISYITIPDTVTLINSSAFTGCLHLQSISFEKPDGWFATHTPIATSGKSVDFTNATNNVEILTNNSASGDYFKHN
ncbi:MAG: leucine-rich repeat domain-containing protein [Clostridia bacterium]|nr:leucine-rich repeat domain-containing protein [Clostridia bacterium]